MTREQLQQRHPNSNTADYIQHPNGGGWRHKTAIVPDTVTLPEYCLIGNYARVGNHARVGDGASVGDGAQITTGRNVVHMPSAYRYNAFMYFNETDNKWWVQLGCHLRTIEEWDADFWNNPSEFPNNGSEKSNDRLRVYTALKTMSETLTKLDTK